MRRVAIVALCFFPAIVCGQGFIPTKFGFPNLPTPTSVAFSPDGSTIAVAGLSGVQFYEAANGMPISGIVTPDGAAIVAYSPDGKTLAIGGAGGNGNTIQLWNLPARTLRLTIPISAASISALAFSPNGITIADVGVNGSKGVAEMWNVSGGYQTASLPTGLTSIGSVAFTPNGADIVLGGINTSNKGCVQVWQIPNAKQIATLKTAAATPSVAMSSDGITLAVGDVSSFQGVLELWNIASKNLVASLPTSMQSDAPFFTADGKTLIALSKQYVNGFPFGFVTGVAETWDVATRKKTSYTNTLDNGAFALSPDSQSFASIGSGIIDPPFTNGSIQAGSTSGFTIGWATVTGETFRTGPPPVFSPDGSTVLGVLLGTLYTSQLGVWSTSTGQLESTLSAPPSSVQYTCAYSPDGRTIAAGCTNGATGSGVIQFWDASSFAPTHSWNLDFARVGFMSYSPDGTKLAISGLAFDETPRLEIIDVASGAVLERLQTSANQGATNLTFSPDSSTLADIGGSIDVSNYSRSYYAELWNVATGAVTQIPIQGVIPSSIAFSPDGSTLALGGSNGSLPSLQLWSVADATLASTLTPAAGTQLVDSVAFSPDGKILFAGAGPSAGLQGFDAASGALLGYFSDSTFNLTVSPSGTTMAFLSSNGDFEVAAVPSFDAIRVASLVVTPTSIVGGKSVTGVVTLAQPALSGGAVVGLSTNDSYTSVPEVVFIPAGETGASFPIATPSVNTPRSVMITASSGMYFATARLVETPPIIRSISVQATSVVGGADLTGTVTIGTPAGANGMIVPISSSIPTIESLSAVIESGQTTGTFVFFTPGVSEKTTCTLTASDSMSSAGASFTLLPPSLSKLTIASTSVAGGSSSSGVVVLTGFAGQSGLVVSLSSSSDSVSLPSTVTVDSGTNQVSFPISTFRVAAQRSVKITAKAGSVTKSAGIVLRPH